MTFTPERSTPQNLGIDPAALAAAASSLGSPRPRVLKPAAYGRVSELNKAGEDVSVDSQLESIHELLVREGITVPAANYEDRVISASRYSRKQRPGYERLLEDIRRGAVNCVGLWDIDRLLRQPKELEVLLDLADQFGVQLFAVTGRHDPSTAQGRLVLRMMVNIAAYESDHKAERIAVAMKRNAASGKSHGGMRPYGFAFVEGRGFVQHVPEEVAVVLDIVTRTLAHHPLRATARYLNQNGIKTSKGNTWGPETVKQVMLSPRIAGKRVHIKMRERTVNGRRSNPLFHADFDPTPYMQEADWEPIISLDTWWELRRWLLRPHRKKWESRVTLLKGLFVCSSCGAELACKSEASRSNPGVRPRYKCMSKWQADTEGRPAVEYLECNRRSFQEEAADSFVAASMLARLAEPSTFTRVMNLITGMDAPDVTVKLEDIARDEELLAQLGRDMAHPDPSKRLPYAVGLQMTQEIEARLVALRREVELATVPSTLGLPDFRSVQEMSEWWNDGAIPKEDKRNLLRLLVAKVELHANAYGRNAGPKKDTRRITIHWQI